MQKFCRLLIVSSLFITPRASCENPEVLRCPEAAQAFKDKDYAVAHERANKTCSTLRDLARWKQLRYGKGEVAFPDYIAFSKSHGSWPWMGDVRQSAELKLNENTPQTQVLSWFKSHGPKRFQALVLYLKALKGSKKTTLYKKVFVECWHRFSLSLSEEKQFLGLGKGLLTQADHLKRLKHFLSKKDHAVVARQIERCAPSIGPYLQTRLALSRGDDKAPQLFKTLTKAEQSRLDILQDYFSYLQRKESRSIHSFIKKYEKDLAKDPQRFWRLRYIAARDALVTKDYQKVFEALDGHGLTSGGAYVDVQFLLGFVALRFLEDPELALSYLEPAYGHIKNPNTLSRFSYWISVAYEKKVMPEKVTQWLETAKEHPQTFYGQEAFAKMGQDLTLSFLRLHYKDSERRSVLQSPYMKYAILLKSLGAHEDIAPFLYKIYYALKGNGEKRAFLALCHQEFPEYLYDMARLSGVIYNYKETYPILSQGVKMKDPAIVHAIMRKESGFNPYAVSGAGALGLMQLMPKTAEIIGKKLGHKVSASDLIENPELNMLLGEAYFSQKLETFQGHKEITLAGYNAGPMNSLKWIQRYGDPRTDEIDLLTWIELLPYEETRCYIRRVMANYRVYQSLLKD